MSFLNPFYLAALAAVAIPLLVHILSRRRVPIFYFSSLRFLRESDRRSMRRVNLRRILLMVLRMAGVALLAIAFARPVVRGKAAALFPGGGSLAGCLLIDRSYSMGVESGEGTLFDEARSRAEEILDRFSAGDEVTVILFDASRDVIYRGDGNGKTAGLFLDEARLSYGTTDLRGAVRAGLDALRESGRESRELYILSDFQRSSLAAGSMTGGTARVGGGADSTAALLPVRAYLVRVGDEPPSNGAIERVLAPAATLHRGEIATIQLTLSGDGGEARFPVALYLDGRRVLERELEAGGSGSERASFSFPVERSGWLRGEVRKRPDRLRADDRRFFALRVVERVPVLLVADEQRLYMEQALSPEGAETDIALGLKEYGELTSNDLERTAVLVLGPGRGLAPPDLEVAERFVDEGGRILAFIPPGLEETIVSLTGHPVSIEWEELGERFVTIEKPLAAPYFLRPLGAGTMDAITGIRFTRAALVSGVPREEVLLRFSNGHPCMWEERRGEGSILFCAIDPVPGAGELVLSPYFLPILQQAVLVTGESASDEGVSIGETIRWRGGLEGGARYEMPGGPDGGERVAGVPALLARKAGEADGRGAELVLPGAESPGFVTLADSADTLALFAVNPDCRLESKLAAAPPAEAADSLGLDHYIAVGANEPIAAAVRRGREGREITVPIALAAILLFVTESIVAQRRYEGGEDVG